MCSRAIAIGTFGALAACVVATGLVVRAQGDDASRSPTPLKMQVVVLQQTCRSDAQAGVMAEVRRREEQSQRAWCGATRDARRREFQAAFVQSVRKAKHGGKGLSKTVDEFIKQHPEAIKPGANTVVCEDANLRIDDQLMAQVVNEPSIVGQMFGVPLRGTWVSRLNPVPRWEELVKDGVYIRSTQMQYSTPLPIVAQPERTRLIQDSVTARCPSVTDVDRVLEARAVAGTTAGNLSAGGDSSRAEVEQIAGMMLGDTRVRQRLGPLMQARSMDSVPEACEKELRALLTFDDIERRLATELASRADVATLERVMAVMRRVADGQWFTSTGALRIFQPENDRLNAAVSETYGPSGQASWMVDVADVTTSANQAYALAMADWSAARITLSTQGCPPNSR